MLVTCSAFQFDLSCGGTGSSSKMETCYRSSTRAPQVDAHLSVFTLSVNTSKLILVFTLKSSVMRFATRLDRCQQYQPQP
ncbi:TPA: hypothetical protein N0F65_001088, partial [Lagenidium giganteum]